VTTPNGQDTDRPARRAGEPRHKRAQRHVERRMPKQRWARLLLGGGLVVGGILGFLPILGFWMIPLGLFVLSYDLPAAARARSWLEAKYEDWRDRR
jgi:hypothetical protein